MIPVHARNLGLDHHDRGMSKEVRHILGIPTRDPVAALQEVLPGDRIGLGTQTKPVPATEQVATDLLSGESPAHPVGAIEPGGSIVAREAVEGLEVLSRNHQSYRG